MYSGHRTLSAAASLIAVIFIGAAGLAGTGGCGANNFAGQYDEPPSETELGGGEDQGNVSTPLEIVSTYPEAGASSVSPLTGISATFNRPLGEGELSSVSLSLSDGNADVDGAVSYDGGNATILFTPNGMLQRNALYAAAISVQDVDSQGWEFTTDPAYYVGVDGDDGAEGIREYPWQSIRHAVEAVPAESTIRVLAGAYSEAGPIVVGKSLSLIGEGRDSTVIGPPSGIGADFADKTILDVVGADDDAPDNISVTIEGFTIDAAETAGLKFGVLLRGGAYAVVRNCVLKGAMEAEGSVNSGNITVGWNDFGYKARALIENNLVTDFHSFGIAVYGTGNEAVIRGNEIVGNPPMHICSSSPGTWAGAMGIVIQSNESATVEGNTITGIRRNPSCNPASYDSAIEIYWPGDMLITGNVIEDNDYGFASYAAYGSAATLELDGNDILDNDVGVQLGNLNIVSVHENNIEGNSLFGVRNTMAGAVDVTNNYWGNADGPTPPGSGDAVSGNLIVAPFSASRWE